MKENEFIIKRGISDRNERQLILNEGFIKFENKDYIRDAFSVIEKDKIIGLRYGIKRISLFGIDFQIFVQHSVDKQLKIDFTTYFNLNKSKYFELYREILNSMWELYFGNIANQCINKFNKEIEFEIAGIHINQTGIFYNEGVINPKKIEIPWENVRTFNYHRHFVIAHSEKMDTINKQLSYHEDWNISVLNSVVRAILNHKEIEIHE